MAIAGRPKVWLTDRRAPVLATDKYMYIIVVNGDRNDARRTTGTDKPFDDSGRND